MKRVDFSLILACFNEGPTFEESLNKILKELKKLKLNWEIIFVEDKSSDNTKSVLLEFAKKNKNCRVILHKKNTGRGRAVADGINAARGNICGYIDVDCEISPHYIPLFIKEIKKGSDLVVGKRFYEKGLKSLQRVIASRFYAFIVKLILEVPIEDTEAGYKFFNKKQILAVLANVKNRGWFWDTEICARAYYKGLEVSQLPVLFIRRSEKKSTVNLVSDSLDYIVNLYKFRKQISKLSDE